MGFLFKRRTQPSARAVEPVDSDFPKLRDADLGAAYAGEREAGDFYDSFRVTPSRVLFGLLDVAGRRAENASILAEAQQVFRDRGTELFAPPEVNEAEALTELCVELNRAIMGAADGVRSCPAFAACYNEELGIVCYVNAGHTPGLVRTGDQISDLDATGLPLGLFSHATCDAPIVALPPGSALLLASRGVLEAKCRDEEFGLSNLKHAFNQAPLTNAHELCASVLNHVQDFTCTPPREDDLTALAIVRHTA
jgi:serine phosphatase RsbU (regulator of sigma subunit)